MRQTSVVKHEIKLMGVSVRTSYTQELDKMKGKISHASKDIFMKPFS